MSSGVSSSAGGRDAAHQPDEHSLTVHSSWSGLISVAAGALMLAAIAGVAVTGGALNWWRIVLVLFALLGLFAAFFDFPVSSRFDPDGVERRMLLRRQYIEFSERTRLTRARPSPTRLLRGLRHGGLALGVGRLRIMLVDRCESEDEYDRLVELLETGSGPGASVGASQLPRPDSGVSPTWLYRDKKWRPDWAKKR